MSRHKWNVRCTALLYEACALCVFVKQAAKENSVNKVFWLCRTVMHFNGTVWTLTKTGRFHLPSFLLYLLVLSLLSFSPFFILFVPYLFQFFLSLFPSLILSFSFFSLLFHSILFPSFLSTFLLSFSVFLFCYFLLSFVLSFLFVFLFYFFLYFSLSLFLPSVYCCIE